MYTKAGFRDRRFKVTNVDVMNIRTYYEEGMMNVRQLMSLYDLSDRQVRGIIKGSRRGNVQ